jgi:hypothetical protein
VPTGTTGNLFVLKRFGGHAALCPPCDHRIDCKGAVRAGLPLEATALLFGNVLLGLLRFYIGGHSRPTGQPLGFSIWVKSAD